MRLAAEALGCEVGAIANSLLFDAGGAPVLILTSGAHRVDTAKPDRAVRTGPIPADAQVTVPEKVLRSYVGTYATDAGPKAVVAMGADGWLTIQLNSPPLQMRPVSQTEFMVDEARSRVVFHPENGKVNRFTIKRGARELTGTRISR